MPVDYVMFVNTVFVPIGLMLIMFSLGLTLALRDFGLVLTNAKWSSPGLRPAFADAAARACAGRPVPAPPELALGLFILGICPAARPSNALTFAGAAISRWRSC